MRTAPSVSFPKHQSSVRGVTLVELIVFIVIISVALVVLLNVFAFQVTNSVDPVARVKALERGQAVLDEILSRKFAEDTPTGGVPACGSVDDPDGICAGITSDGDFDDVGDYNGITDNTDSNYPVSIQVAPAGADLGLGNNGRLITVTVTASNGETLTLNAYKANF